MAPISDCILHLIVSTRIMTEEQIDRFLFDNEIDRKDGITVLTLLQKGMISDEQVAQCMALYLKISYTNLRHAETNKRVLDLIEHTPARFIRCVPFISPHGEITVAIEDPFDEAQVRCVNFFFGSDVGIAVCTKSAMDWALQQYYPEQVRIIECDDDPSTNDAPSEKDGSRYLIETHRGDQLV